jgi:hypothetical protein
LVGSTGDPLDVVVTDGFNHGGNAYLAGIAIIAEVLGSGYSMHGSASGVMICERVTMNQGLGVDVGPNAMVYFIDCDLTNPIVPETFVNTHGFVGNTSPSRMAFVGCTSTMRLGYGAVSTLPDELWVIGCDAPSWHSAGDNLQVHVDGLIPPYAGNTYGTLTTSDDLPPMPIHGTV